jgi:hypothetical protein
MKEDTHTADAANIVSESFIVNNSDEMNDATVGCVLLVVVWYCGSWLTEPSFS